MSDVYNPAQQRVIDLLGRTDERPHIPDGLADELRAEIGRVSTAALDKVLPSVLDDATQQSLVENFIAKVGASR